MVGGTRGRARRSMAASSQHRRRRRSTNTARQPNAAAISPLTVRASRIPISRPLITVPTTAPRSCSADSERAHRHDDLSDHRVTPTTAMRRREHDKAGAAAATRQPGGGDQQRAADQRAALAQVADRDQQRQPDHVSELGDRDEQPGGALGDAEGARPSVCSSGWA